MSTIDAICPEAPDVPNEASEHAYAIAERVVEVLTQADRIIGEFRPHDLDSLAEDIELILSVPQRYESPTVAKYRELLAEDAERIER